MLVSPQDPFNHEPVYLKPTNALYHAMNSTIEVKKVVREDDPEDDWYLTAKFVYPDHTIDITFDELTNITREEWQATIDGDRGKAARYNPIRITDKDTYRFESESVRECIDTVISMEVSRMDMAPALAHALGLRAPPNVMIKPAKK